MDLSRGLSNLEMKRVGKLAMFGALLKAVKTSCVRTMQGRTYLRKNRLFRWLPLHTYYKIATVVELQLNMHGVVKVMGSLVKLDTPENDMKIWS